MFEGPQQRVEQNGVSPEAEKVTACETLDELRKVLEEIGPVQGSSAVHHPRDIWHRIEQVRHGHRGITFVTQTYKIREKVTELLEADPTYKKYSSPKYNKSA
jgi:peptide subunit release factor RF-3